ncbi:MAG: DUF3179 domain-containing protein [Anaerolinea sp.]|nr:DUF3179 domain-containing protein [Anaerolinea sp.]
MTLNPLYTSEFKIDRVLVFDRPTWNPLLVTKTFSLANALEAEMINRDARVMLLHVDETVYVFQTLHLAFHHVIQGDHNGKPWMVSFCVVCNAGAAFVPVVEGKVHHFAGNAMYNAMTLLSDAETGSYWNHLTGECLHGELKGAKLHPLGAIYPMTAAQAWESYPDARVIFSQLNLREQLEAEEDYGRLLNEPKELTLSDMLLKTLDIREDNRMPRLDMGLGVWTNETARYYPYTRLNVHNNALIDVIDGRKLVVYIDAASMTPGAFYTDAYRAVWRGSDLNLGTGDVFRAGLLHTADGKIVPERPKQLFVRWYAFAFTFPGCDIFAG